MKKLEPWIFSAIGFAFVTILIDACSERPRILDDLGWSPATAYQLITHRATPIAVGAGLALLMFGIAGLVLLFSAYRSSPKRDRETVRHYTRLLGVVSGLFGTVVGLLYRMEALRIEEGHFEHFYLLLRGLIVTTIDIAILAAIGLLLVPHLPARRRRFAVDDMISRKASGAELAGYLTEVDADFNLYRYALYAAVDRGTTDLMPLVRSFVERFPWACDRYWIPSIEGVALVEAGDFAAAERRLQTAMARRGDAMAVASLARIFYERGDPVRAARWAETARRICENIAFRHRILNLPPFTPDTVERLLTPVPNAK